MSDREIVLDDAAEQLFRDLGGVDVQRSSGFSVPGLTEALHEEEKRLDAWRLLLVDYAHEAAGLVSSAKKGAVADALGAIDPILDLLAKLAKLPGRDQRIIIRYRGRPVPYSGRASLRYDYHILYGSLDLDISGVVAASRRLGVTASRLPGKITTAFETLAENKVVNLMVHLGEWEAADRERVRVGFGHLVDYLAGRPKNPPKNEGGRPDPNLYALCAVNKLKPETAAGLFQKVSGMLACNTGEAMELFTGTYDAVWAFRKLREQLARPAVELNNPRWSVAATDTEAVPRAKIRAMRFLSLKLGADSPDAVRILDALFAADYGQVTSQDVLERMTAASWLLFAAEKNVGGKHMKDMANWVKALTRDVCDAVKSRLALAPEEAFDDIIVSGDVLKGLTEKGKVVEKKVHRRIQDLVSFYKQRSVIKRKVKGMVKSPTEFDLQDYEVMAEDFGITAEGAKEMVGLLKGCFDSRGHFLRPAFEKNLPGFARYEDSVFEFLWYYLKEIMNRHDRIAFLNALQLLIDQVKQRRSSLSVLLNDFILDPEQATYSDRNALMLSNLLLRKYSKELHTDIEITPEEVLLVQEGLDPEVVEYARGIVDGAREDFYLKVRTIHRKLKESLDPYESADVMPSRYVFTLEREIYIFLALVDGQVARAVLRSAAKEYGNPESEIYWQKKSEEQMPGLLQIFQVVVRGLGRIGETSDLVFLKELLNRENDFIALSKEPHHRDQVRRVMKHVDSAQRAVMQSRFRRERG
ncbi:MAG: hypothetical protein JRI97_10315 [Deltaproteobacteria bacterium]|nr:hypothetical protein [Deltaproteobacteria bacterium]